MGHPNGGVAAAEACRADRRLDACVNIDGQHAGGPFSADATGMAPPQPFLFLTKEQLLHPEIGSRLEAAGEGAYRVVIPSASHEQFADGALLEPALTPLPRTADRVLTTARGMTLAFFDITLRDAQPSRLAAVHAPADVYVNVYPLGDQPPLPAR